MLDKATETLIDALKLAVAESGEQRLFKAGKLEGLFPNRSGSNGEAAARALREGFLEVVRTEVKGKTTIEWVRLTPRGVEFLHDHESPVQALRDLQAILQVTRAGVPMWLTEMRQELQTLASRLTDEAQRWTQRLDALSQRVEEALRRAEAGGPPLPQEAIIDAPWAEDALAYLDRRQVSGAPEACPLPELFGALREQYTNLSVTAFHDRLRRLRDRQALRLYPFTGPPGEMPEPEYALLDGATLLYFVSR
jgi:DNA-binding PadR family transcriptional regulator